MGDQNSKPEAEGSKDGDNPNGQGDRQKFNSTFDVKVNRYINSIILSSIIIKSDS